MKKITLLCLIFCSFTFAQNQDYNLDFESDGPDGDVCNWITFENIAPPEIIDNPDPDGVNNTVSKVLKVIAPTPVNGGQCFSGVNNAFAVAAFGEWDITQSNDNIISIDVNKNYVGTVGVQMIGRDQSAPVNITNQNVNNSVVDEWITLTYTIPPPATGLGTNVTAVVVFIDFTCGGPDRTQDAVLHVDNIKFNANKVLDPTTPNFVTSFSEEFESTTSFIADEAISGGIVANTETTGINSSPNCFEINGINNAAFTNAQLTLTAPETLDFCSDKGFSIMVRGPRAIQVRIKVEENGAGEEVNDDYTEVGNWQELSYDFSAFQNRNWNRIVIFFDIQGASSANANDDIFFFDNLNFDNNSSLSIDDVELELVTVSPNPTKDSWEMRSINNQQLTSVVIYDILGKEVLNLKPGSTEVSINASNLKNGIYLAKLKSAIGIQTIKLIKN